MMCSKGCGKVFGVLAVIAGLVHLVPQLYTWLTDLTGGTPWIQIVVGALLVLSVLIHLFGGCKKCKACQAPTHSDNAPAGGQKS